MVDEPELRLSDADRNHAVEQLRQHTGEGRLTLDEFSERVETVFAARYPSDLAPALDGLPVTMPAPEPQVPLAMPPLARQGEVVPVPATGEWSLQEKPGWVVALMSGAHRKGSWRVKRRTNALAIMGGAKIDLRSATIEGNEIEITCFALMGSVEVIVPEGFPVDFDGFVLMGGRHARVASVPAVPGAPTIRVRAYGMWGGVDVRSKPPSSRTKGSSSRRPRERHRHSHGVESLAPAPDAPPAVPAVTAVTAGTTGTVTILVTDIVGSTSHAERLGDQRWLEVLQAHNVLVRDEIARFGGTEVKHSGDGFLATFGSARAAVRTALGVNLAVERHRTSHPDPPIEVRIGLHAGEVEHDGDDVFGVNVSTASRVAGAAAPGEVLVSGVVRDLAESSSDLRFGTAREVELAGRSLPLRVHSVSGAG